MSKTYHWALRISPSEIKLFKTNDEARIWHAANFKDEGSFRELFRWNGPEESDNQFMADHAMESRENTLLQEDVQAGDINFELMAEMQRRP